MESFLASLKREMVHRHAFATREAARQDVFSRIEVWYNRRRRHWAQGYLSPEEFERNRALPMAA